VTKYRIVKYAAYPAAPSIKTGFLPTLSLSGPTRRYAKTPSTVVPVAASPAVRRDPFRTSTRERVKKLLNAEVETRTVMESRQRIAMFLCLNSSQYPLEMSKDLFRDRASFGANNTTRVPA